MKAAIARRPPRAPRLDIVYQEAWWDCGAACLCMVLRYFGKDSTLHELRHKLNASPKGTDAQTLVRVATEYGLHGTGFMVESSQLGALRRPWILHIKPRHFVVFAGKRAGGMRIYDPARGIKVLPRSQFTKLFSGVALCFEPRDSAE